ncbi:phosphoribosyltransferase family protein [Kitasatospora sp. NPDC058184]|uniref:phosphoribosyltransferase family protein n=1 Tax=Kitasatospora sp. NPDC058184 TaxID=3346370 RepID=UPI0036D8C32C
MSTRATAPASPDGAAAPGSSIRHLDWDDVQAQAARIAAAIRTDGVPQTVVAVVRGGMVPAVLLAHQLGVRDVRALEVTHTVDDSANAAKTTEPMVRNPASLGGIDGLDVLVVDDVVGTGQALASAVRIVEQAGAARVRSAVLVVNEANWTGGRPPGETVTWIGETVRGWVVFPWEASASAGAEGAS